MMCFEPPEEDCGNIALVVAPIGLTVSDVLCSVVFPVSWQSAARRHSNTLNTQDRTLANFLFTVFTRCSEH